jgi:hypothetical protein
MVTDEFTGDLMEARGEWDDDGFHLILETDEDRANIRVFSTDIARVLLREVNRLRPWLEEEQRERAAYDGASPEERDHVLRHIEGTNTAYGSAIEGHSLRVER